MAALLAVGLVAGLLIVIPWVSPGLPGLALLALTSLYLASVRRAVHLIPLKTHIYGQGFEAVLLNGVLALAGLALVIPLFIPSRWRRRAGRYLGEPVPAGPWTSLLSSISEATQQGTFFPPQDQYTSPTIIQHDPFPPSGPAGTGGDPFPPAHRIQENPLPQR